MTLVPLHPEAVDGDPAALRWVMPAGTLPFVGAPARLPTVVRSLVEDGTIVALVVEPVAIVARLAAGASWRAAAPRVRAALSQGLADAGAWAAYDPSSGPDDVLRAAVGEVLAGEVGAYVRSHGGEVSVVSVGDDQVTLRLTGACAHCPASDLTLRERVEVAVRARYPALRSVTATDVTPDLGRGRRRLPLLRA